MREDLRITDTMVATVRRYIAGVSDMTALRMLEAVHVDDPLLAENERLREAANEVVEMLSCQSNPVRDGGSAALVDACYELAAVLIGLAPC